MKTKFFIYSIIAVAVLVIGNIIYSAFKVAPCIQLPVNGQESKYFFLFNPKIVANLKLIHSFQNTKSNQFAYRFHDSINIIILHDTEFNHLKIGKMQTVKNIIFNKSEDWETPHFSTEYGKLNLRHICTPKIENFKIRLGNQTKILDAENGNNYQSYFIELKEMSIANELDKDFIRFSIIESKVVCNLIICKQGENVYVILVYPRNQNSIDINTAKRFLKLE